MPAPTTTPVRATGLAADLRVAVLRTSRRLRAEKSDADLSDAQFSVLAYLAKEGATTPGVLAEHEHVQPPSMTRTINALVAAGYLTRAPGAVDRRQVLVDLSDAGRDVVRETRRRRDAWLTRRLAQLSPDERETLARAADILRRLTTT